MPSSITHDNHLSTMGKRKPYYGVAKGRTVGVFQSWYSRRHSAANPIREHCKASVDGFSGAIFRGFGTRADALSYVAGYGLMEKANRDLDQSRGEAAVPLIEGGQSSSLPAQMPPPLQSRNVFQNSTLSRDNTTRIVSHINLDDEEFDIIDISTSQPPSSDNSSSPPSTSRPKRSGITAKQCYSKKRRRDDQEIIDLTESPHKGGSRQYDYAYRENSVSPEPVRPLPGSYPHTQLFADAKCSDEQLRILELVSQGKNVFFTGSAGVGKSFVLNKISELFKARGLKQFEDFFITASTGSPQAPFACRFWALTFPFKELRQCILEE